MNKRIFVVYFEGAIDFDDFSAVLWKHFTDHPVITALSLKNKPATSAELLHKVEGLNFREHAGGVFLNFDREQNSSEEMSRLCHLYVTGQKNGVVINYHSNETSIPEQLQSLELDGYKNLHLRPLATAQVIAAQLYRDIG